MDFSISCILTGLTTVLSNIFLIVFLHIVHYIEYSEYLNDNEKTKIRNVGDILSAEIRIDLVSNSYITNRELDFYQDIDNSSSIKAIIEVKEVIDEYTIFAKTSLCNEVMLIEFENKITYQQNDRVYIEGSLEIEPSENDK